MSAKAWWEYKVEGGKDSRADIANSATAYAERLWNEDSDRRLDIERNMRRYSAKSLRGLFASGLSPDRDNVRLNLTKQAISTLVARVGASRPRPRCLTTGAKYETRQRSKQLQKFLDVMFQVEKVHAIGAAVFRDAALFGTGIIRPYKDVNAARVRVERVFPAELLVDQLDALDAEPTIFVRVKFMTRTRLREMCSGEYVQSKAIDDVPSVPPSELPSSYAMSDNGAVETLASHVDLVRVYELTKTGGYDDEGKVRPGTRVVCAGSVLLAHEEYDSEEPPYLWFHWCSPLRGFWGDSAAAEIRGPEREVNRLMQKVQRSMRLAGQPWVLHEEGSMQAPKITDEPGLLVAYKKGYAPPSIQTHQPVHPALMQQALTLKAEAFSAIGLNELQVSGTKPAGIESGRGLEQLGEEHSMRFRDVSQAYEQFIAVELASRLVATARDLDKCLREADRGGYKVRGKIGKDAAVIDWKDAGIAPDDMTITCWPSSILPQTPSARAEEIQRLIDSGMVTPEEGQRLFEIPDLESETSLMRADSDLVDWQLSNILDKGKMVAPNETQNLAYAMKRGTLALLEATRLGAPMDHLDMLRDWLGEVDALVQAAQGVTPDPLAMPTDPAAAAMGAPPAPMPMDPAAMAAMGAPPVAL